jgi:RNA 3'-phosphate cyclase
LLKQSLILGMIHIDGSYEEGGGQIVRTALALSALTCQPFRMDKIRDNRPKPGLKRQHLSCVEALQQICDARVSGARPGSVLIDFFPSAVKAANLAIDIGTAGSITLLLQALLLPCLFADDEIRLSIRGGTDTRWSVPADFFAHVILPFYTQFASIKINKIQRGFYPKGQGCIDLTIVPRYHLNDFSSTEEFITHLRRSFAAIYCTEKPCPTRIKGISSASSQLKNARVAERQTEGAAAIMSGRYPLELDCEYQPTASPGTVITLWAVAEKGMVIAGADALGEKGLRAEAVGAMAARKLLEILNSDAAMGHHLADNLVPLLAIVGGSIKPDHITGHIRSNIYVCEQFLDVRFQIDETLKLIQAA